MELSARMIQTAADALAYWEPFTRDSAPDETWHKLTDARPDWLYNAVRAAHGTDRDGAPAMLPDDYRYEFSREALQAIADADEGDDTDDLADDLEADIYTADLTAWLSSHGHRPGYCDDAADGMGNLSTVERMQLGQLAERREVFAVIARAVLYATDDDPDEYDD